MDATKYLEFNKDSWNARLESHLKSDFYNLDAFKAGETSLNGIELKLLGEIRGKSILHLQCHFGQDSISLARIGAQVTAIDFSDDSINEARKLAKELNQDVEFICCDIYSLKEHLNKQYDIVFTSYGTIAWLPDLEKWSEIISHFLKPKGRFIFVEFHPVVWMFDDDVKEVIYHYHNVEPIIEEKQGTYADTSAEINKPCITWNHSITEVLTSLLNNNHKLKSFQEFDYSPYPFVKSSLEISPGKYIIKHHGNKLPLVYAIETEFKV